MDREYDADRSGGYLAHLQLKFNTLLLLKAERSPHAEDISLALAFAFFYRLHVAYER
jgi:hypothetical protein